MIQDLNRQDLARLLRGCEPPLEMVDMLEEHDLGEYEGGMGDHWEWADEDDDCWQNVSEQKLWELYTVITGDDRANQDCMTQVYVLAESNCDDEVDVKAVFTDRATAERYKEANDLYCDVEEGVLNPRFEERERLWVVWLVLSTMEMTASKPWSEVLRQCVGYVQRSDNGLTTWVVARNSEEAKEKAGQVMLAVTRGREQGRFRYLNQKIYLPDRKFPDIKKYPFYDVTSGRIVLGDFGAVLLPQSEALLPDGTPNPDLFILLDRHFVDNFDKKWGL